MRLKLPAIAFLFGLAMSPAIPVLATQQGYDQPQIANVAQADAAWTDGTVKKVNTDTGKVTISHGPLPSLDMPPMTMVFRVKDPAWLNQMKPGDRIRFVVERVNGTLTVTEFRTGQ